MEEIEVPLEQSQASDRWSHFQAKSIRSSLLTTKVAVLEAIGKPVPPQDEAKQKQYEKDQEELMS